MAWVSESSEASIFIDKHVPAAAILELDARCPYMSFALSAIVFESDLMNAFATRPQVAVINSGYRQWTKEKAAHSTTFRRPKLVLLTCGAHADNADVDEGS